MKNQTFAVVDLVVDLVCMHIIFIVVFPLNHLPFIRLTRVLVRDLVCLMCHLIMIKLLAAIQNMSKIDLSYVICILIKIHWQNQNTIHKNCISTCTYYYTFPLLSLDFHLFFAVNHIILCCSLNDN